ncbi:MAG: ATP-dependent DNA helicase UvrD2 [Spirochaetaceae bacterium]|nr:ATP-dependent DNA helicase UvrD2 [Spirochaetaceae bacterium]
MPDADALLEMLDPEQREVATTLTGPLCVLAGAGTGKTRAITARIAYGVASGVLVPQRVLAVTFTARAAGEMRTRLRVLGATGVQARTFHAAALRQLRYFWPRHVGGELPPLVEHKAALVAESAGRLRLATDRATVRDLAAEIEWVKVTMTDHDDYPAAAAKVARPAPAGLDPAMVVRLLSTYDQVKRERHVIDFEDVLLYTVGLIAEHRQVADAVRGQYHHLVVDEYQDVSPLQQALLDQWLGGRDEMCVVGDPHQTIYTFAGATPDFLLGFRERYAGAKEVRLVRDYRSTPQVVALANRLVTAAPAGRHGRLELVAQRPPGPAPDLREHADEPAEARWVASRVRELTDGGLAPSEVAVLFRTNGQSESYEQALADAGVPYVLRGGERFFDRPEVREARLMLRGAARSEDENDDLPETVRGVLSGSGWSATPPEGAGAVRDRWESLAALARLAEDMAAVHIGASLRDFVAELDERAEAQHAPTVEGVTLASLHAAKGLEWDAVFVVGATDGMIPITYAQTPEQVEEERRLLYVGVTRAREHLAISWSLARAPGGRAGRRPSRFLDGMHAGTRSDAPAAGARARGSSRRRGPASCRVCGSALTAPVARKLGRCEDCPSSYDEQLFERLRTWRAEQARTQSVPAYVVFTDATLTALAEVRPSSATELLAVSGVGGTKLERYGADVLAICAGEAPTATVSPGTNPDVLQDVTVDLRSGVKNSVAPDEDLL